jgi:type IV pilus assembly protein PilY1
MLAKKDPFFKHQMFVDATPVAADIQVGGAWKTYLFGGLGKGGKGFYAVDVTAPDDVDSESKAAANVKWEFTDADLGYSYGKPLVGKLRAYDDKWVVMFTSGHNNTSGKGKLYIVDPADGTLLKTLETTAGSEGSPSGLAQVSGFVIDYHNQVIEQVYGGDLLGNVWRFDLSSYDAADFKVEKFATLTSVDGSAQSVTVAPQIEVDFQNGIDRWVMIGTGRLLDESDLVTWADQVQTMYAIRDGTVLEMGKSLPHKPRTDSGFEKLTDGLAGLSVATEKGWLHDLPKGERIIAPIQAEVNLLVYAGSLPPENECLSGLAANIYAREFTRGASQLREKDGEPFVESIYSAEGAVGVELIKLYKGEGAAQPTFRVAITRGTDGKMISFPVNLPGVSAQHRMSWRLLGQ